MFNFENIVDLRQKMTATYWNINGSIVYVETPISELGNVSKVSCIKVCDSVKQYEHITLDVNKENVVPISIRSNYVYHKWRNGTESVVYVAHRTNDSYFGSISARNLIINAIDHPAEYTIPRADISEIILILDKASKIYEKHENIKSIMRLDKKENDFKCMITDYGLVIASTERSIYFGLNNDVHYREDLLYFYDLGSGRNKYLINLFTKEVFKNSIELQEIASVI